MTYLEINQLSRPERRKLAQRVRFVASRGDELTDGDLDVMQAQIERGQVDRILAHYVTQLEVRCGTAQ